MSSSSSFSRIKIKTKKGMIPLSYGLVFRRLLSLGIPSIDVINYINEFSSFVTKNIITTAEYRQLLSEFLENKNPLYKRRHELLIQDFKEYHPILLLIGGVTGVGKSSMSLELNKLFMKSSTISTDFVREIMRATFNKAILPSIYESSYNVGSLYHSVGSSNSDMIYYAGFRLQAKQVQHALQQFINDYLYENKFTIVEGVHVTPDFRITSLTSLPQVHSLNVLLVTKDEEQHFYRLKKRSSYYPGREFNLELHFERIRVIQERLIGLAKQQKTPIVYTDDPEKGFSALLNLFWKRLLNT